MANRARARDDDFTIDFAQHIKDVESAIESEAKYWRENDAKFRAVKQKVATYDEFRDIVSASHLKPLEKGDRMCDMNNKRFNQPWNICAKNGGKASQATGASVASEEFTLPATSLEFARDWRRQPDPDKKLIYISSIPTEHLRRMLQNDTGCDLMGEIIILLSSSDQLNVEWAIELLEILARCDRFCLSLQFMDSKESSACDKLLKRLLEEARDEAMKLRVEELGNKYDIKS